MGSGLKFDLKFDLRVSGASLMFRSQVFDLESWVPIVGWSLGFRSQRFG